MDCVKFINSPAKIVDCFASLTSTLLLLSFPLLCIQHIMYLTSSFQNILKEILYVMFDIIFIEKNKKLIFKVNNSLTIYFMFIYNVLLLLIYAVFYTLYKKRHNYKILVQYVSPTDTEKSKRIK